MWNVFKSIMGASFLLNNLSILLTKLILISNTNKRFSVASFLKAHSSRVHSDKGKGVFSCHLCPQVIPAIQYLFAFKTWLKFVVFIGDVVIVLEIHPEEISKGTRASLSNESPWRFNGRWNEWRRSAYRRPTSPADFGGWWNHSNKRGWNNQIKPLEIERLLRSSSKNAPNRVDDFK